jgi:DNA-binding HxlR family transcriptional regulator
MSINTSGNLARALDVIGDRWTLQVVAGLLDGPQRFGELAADLNGIAPNVLTARLRQLERDGLIVATPYSQRPVRLAYALTDAGRELGDAIALLAAWGARQSGDTEGPVHAACGTALETRLYCPTCERPADDLAPQAMSWV